MTQQTERLKSGIRRRTALKAGVTVASGLAFGSAAIGTVGANGTSTARAFPIHHFVRAADDAEPSPKPDPQDLLVERRQGNPVDNGDDVGPDGNHQLRWGDYSAVNGVATLECVPGGTNVTVEVSGLVPRELYTFWVIVFESPGFIDTRDLAVAAQNVVGVGSLGAPDGTENSFRAKGGTGRLDVFHPAGDLSLFGSVGCLLDEYEVHLVGAFHLDDETWGPAPEPEPGSGTIAEHVGFKVGTGV